MWSTLNSTSEATHLITRTVFTAIRLVGSTTWAWADQTLIGWLALATCIVQGRCSFACIFVQHADILDYSELGLVVSYEHWRNTILPVNRFIPDRLYHYARPSQVSFLRRAPVYVIVSLSIAQLGKARANSSIDPQNLTNILYSTRCGRLSGRHPLVSCFSLLTLCVDHPLISAFDSSYDHDVQILHKFTIRSCLTANLICTAISIPALAFALQSKHNNPEAHDNRRERDIAQYVSS